MPVLDSVEGEFSLVEAASKRAGAANRIMLALFEGKLKAGERLVLARLSSLMNISATPIREALVELESIGIITIIPHRGAVCNPFGPKQLSEIFQIRRIFEVEAVGQVCEWLTEELKESLLQLRQTMVLLREADNQNKAWSEREIILDNSLHDLLSRYCGSARLMHEIRRYDGLMSVLRSICGNKQNVQQEALEEHISITDAVLNQDKALATSLMAQHITNTGDKIEWLMFGSGG